MGLTWLHISDLHIKSGDPYDRDVVLKALVQSVRELLQRGRKPDLIFVTGDIAHSGKPAEYEVAGAFFDELLQAANLDRKRLFVIPGNHDIDRDFGVGLARTLDSREEADRYFHPDRRQPHLVLKLRAFLDWHNSYFEGVRIAPDNTTCGPVEPVEVDGRRIAILPINSALFCQDEGDHEKLWIGRRCLDAAIAEIAKLRADLNIGLIHHPLEWLHSIEGPNAQAELEACLHVLLHGHLHEARLESVASAEGALLRCAAGAAYQSRKWPNRAFYAKLQREHLRIYPIRYEDSPRPTWTTDPSVFPRDPNHERSFEIPRRSHERGAEEPSSTAQSQPAPPPFRSNIPSRGNRPFVGRTDLIAEMERIFGNPGEGEKVVVLHGQPGVGKSELAREFARLQRERYKGGIFWVDASTGSLAIHLANLGKTVLSFNFPSDLSVEEQGQRSFLSLAAVPVLMIYDNVVSFESIEKWLPLAGMPWNLLITTLNDVEGAMWQRIEVEPLSDAQGIELVEKLTDAAFAARYGKAIATHSGGLPVQIVPETTTLAYDLRRRSDPAPGSALAAPAGQSFRAAYKRLDHPPRLLLHTAAILSPQRIPVPELSRHLGAGIGWSVTEFQRALDACLDLHVLNGASDVSMHQLFAGFLQDTPIPPEDQESLARIRAAQSGRFLELAEVVSANPADSQTAATMIIYPLTPAAWERAGRVFSMDHHRVIGRALYEIGRFPQAQPWYERAVAEEEKGDADGHVDHNGLGSSLDQVGYCLLSTGQYAEARLWYERSVTEKQKGDIDGRIDHASLGGSLQRVGDCLLNLGQYQEARSWFERAVAETEKGDIDGRIDHESLSSSLHLIGDCLSNTSQHDEARPWYERAVAESEKGDVRGRIDYESLARSLHQVGYCLSNRGNYEKAQPWYERAVAETEKGDVHGRIDHGSLAISLYQVGNCLSHVGRHKEAGPWYERAVAEAEKGDVYARVDHDTFGRTMHYFGEWLLSVSRPEDALLWFERAVGEKEKGDIHGHINYASLAETLERIAQIDIVVRDALEAVRWSRRARRARQMEAAQFYSNWERWLAGLDQGEQPPDSPLFSPAKIEVTCVRIRNIRAFEDTGEITLGTDQTLFVGQNSAGKSTLLKCIGLAFLGPTLAGRAEPRPASYLRHGAEKGIIEVAFRTSSLPPDRSVGEFAVGLEINAGETAFGALPIDEMTIKPHNAAIRLDLLRKRSQDRFGFFCGYGGLRTFADTSSLMPQQDVASLDRVGSLFNPYAVVADPDLLSKLLAGNVANLRDSPVNGISEAICSAMRRHVTEVLPETGEFDETCSSILLHSTPVPMRNLSDGYSSVMAMLGHLFQHSLRISGWEQDPAQVGGVVLIDEIDAHLHPSWQRRIMADLKKALPNLQIIATTHSPMVAGSIDSGDIRLLKREGRNARILSRAPSIENWRADQILTSVLFDLPTTRSTKIESLFQQYSDRLAEAGPEDSEVRRLGSIVAKALEIEGEGVVDRRTHELLEGFLLDRFKSLDEETRRLVLARAGLVLGGRS